MKIDYFFPVFNKEKINDFFLNFIKTDFYKKNKEYTMIFCCEKEDKINISFLEKQKEKDKNIKILIFDKAFSFNDAFYNSLKYFNGDVLLLGDLKIKKIDVIFQKCLEKHEKNVQIVHLVKKHNGFKGFVKNTLFNIYNFFIKIFTNKKDRLNVVSLGLIDKDILDLLKELPLKACYLKNTKDLKGFESRSIYIDDKTETSKTSFKQKTSSLVSAITFGIVNVLSLLSIILLNILFNLAPVFNIILGGVLIISLIVVCLYLPKHFFDLRNMISKIEYKVIEK